MNWLTEARAAVEGLGLDTVEMSEVVLVRFRHVNLRFFSNRCIRLMSEELLTPVEVGQFEVIKSRLGRRVWSVK